MLSEYSMDVRLHWEDSGKIQTVSVNVFAHSVAAAEERAVIDCETRFPGAKVKWISNLTMLPPS